MDLRETIVIDDVLPEEEYQKYHDMILNSPNWRFVQDMSYSSEKVKYPSYGFNMTFKHPKNGVLSPLYEAVCVPIINTALTKLNLEIVDVAFNRAFLQIPLNSRFFKHNNGIHVDIPDDHYACVYYLNDCDGDTIIFNETSKDILYGSKNATVSEHRRVSPKKNRMVLFDGSRYHCSSQPTNSYRCIINYDLIFKKDFKTDVLPEEVTPEMRNQITYIDTKGL